MISSRVSNLSSPPSRRRVVIDRSRGNGRGRIRAFAGVVAFSVVAGACGSVVPYAANVNGEKITSADLEDELRSIASNTEYVRIFGSEVNVAGVGLGTFDSAIAAITLTRQIYYRMVGEELERRKIRVSPKDLGAAEAALRERFSAQPTLFDQFPGPYRDTLVRREAELAALTLSLGGVKSPDEAARAFYDANPGIFTQACVRHILLSSREKAVALKARLDAGEPFESLAQSESADTTSAVNGGLVACDINGSSSYVAAFLAAAVDQPVGQVGPPVETEFGFHLIKVDTRKLLSYAEAESGARGAVLDEGQDKVQEVLRVAVLKARIEVNPRYGVLDTQGPSPRVIPQEPPLPLNLDESIDGGGPGRPIDPGEVAEVAPSPPAP